MFNDLGTIFFSTGVLDSQGRDVPQYTEIISKFPALAQAGSSAHPGKNTK